MTYSKHVFIDIDDTLYNYEQSNKEALNQTFSYLSKLSGKSLKEISDSYKESRSFIKSQLLNTSSSHNKLLHFRKLTEILELEISAKTLLELNDIYWDTFYTNLSKSNGLKQLFSFFVDNNFKVIFYTDYNLYFQLFKLKKLKLDFFNSIIYSSEEVGSDKPSTNFKNYIINYAENNINTEDVVYVIGNDEKKDIALIKSVLPCTAFLLVGKTKMKKEYKNIDYIVNNLSEILKIIQTSK